jgi:hypothetical protein
MALFKVQQAVPKEERAVVGMFSLFTVKTTEKCIKYLASAYWTNSGSVPSNFSHPCPSDQ